MTTQMLESLKTEFESEWWPNYPRKVGKLHALRAYIKARQTVDKATLLETMIQGLEHFRFPNANCQYCPHASTWLNGGRWMDEPTVVRHGQLPVKANGYNGNHPSWIEQNCHHAPKCTNATSCANKTAIEDYRQSLKGA